MKQQVAIPWELIHRMHQEITDSLLAILVVVANDRNTTPETAIADVNVGIDGLAAALKEDAAKALRDPQDMAFAGAIVARLASGYSLAEVVRQAVAMCEEPPREEQH